MRQNTTPSTYFDAPVTRVIILRSKGGPSGSHRGLRVGVLNGVPLPFTALTIRASADAGISNLRPPRFTCARSEGLSRLTLSNMTQFYP